MGYSKEQLLSRLQELQIDFAQYEHPVVLTVEAQAKYVGHMKGALSKNLFLKDKKQRFYVVSALAETKVDLKVLSQRLGLGKGGLRMAPEEALAEILQVPLGCVTPFALVNESARHVSLLLDQGIKTQDCCFFHPLSNDMSIALNARDLDKFLNLIEKTPAYIDLEANPPVGKDQPPDLAAFVPSEAKALNAPPESKELPQGSEQNHISANNQSVVTVAKTVKPSNASKKEKSPVAVNSASNFADTDKFVEEILEKTTSLILSEFNEKNTEKNQEQIASKLSEKLGLELKLIATMFKNTAYAEGYTAARSSMIKKLIGHN